MRHCHDMHPDGGGSVGCARVARGSLAPPGGSPAESSVGSGAPVRGIFLRRNLGFGKRQNGGPRAAVVLSFHTDGVMPARNRDVHSEHGRTVTPPALVTIECRGPDGMPAVVVHRIVVSGASRQYPPDAADESSSTASLDRRVSPPERSSDCLLYTSDAA